MINALGVIHSIEDCTKLQLKIPTFDQIYQLVKSKYAYDKVFDWEFERIYHSVFTVNYKDVFDEAYPGAFDAV